MKLPLVLLLLTCVTSISQAQLFLPTPKPKYKTIKQDTINIRGIVYDAYHHPVREFRLTSMNKELVYDGYYIYTTTDTAGKFKLDGALPYDTLKYYWGKRTYLINNGSRFLEIHLPPLIDDDFKIKDTIQVVAKRKTAKKTKTFKVVTNANVLDWYGVMGDMPVKSAPAAKGFTDYIRSKIAYPEKAIVNNIEGDVKIGFNIEKDGSLSNFKILRGIGYGCDEEVINAIKSNTHSWYPYVLNGRPTVSESSLTINFKLTDK
jgi:TonB family protein